MFHLVVSWINTVMFWFVFHSVGRRQSFYVVGCMHGQVRSKLLEKTKMSGHIEIFRFEHHFQRSAHDPERLPEMVSSNKAGWKIPKLNGGFIREIIDK